jgi:cyclohexyl-isocyanide hydratase
VVGNIVTSAGVSSGIDAALGLVARMFGQGEGEHIQLSIEYDPRAPSNVQRGVALERGLLVSP